MWVVNCFQINIVVTAETTQQILNYHFKNLFIKKRQKIIFHINTFIINTLQSNLHIFPNIFNPQTHIFPKFFDPVTHIFPNFLQKYVHGFII